MSIFGANNLPRKICGTEDSSFYLPVVGKPDPKVSWAPGESRPLVGQKAQKGETCWYYAIRMVAPALGPNHPQLEGFEKARKFEKELSSLRKSLTYSQKVNNLVKQAIDALGSGKLEIVSRAFLGMEQEAKQNASAEIADAKNRSLPMDQIRKIEERHKADLIVIEFVKKFCEQTTFQDLNAYNEENFYQKCIQSEIEFFKNVGIDPMVMLMNYQKQISLKEIFPEGASLVSSSEGLEEMCSVKCQEANVIWEALTSLEKEKLLDLSYESVALQHLGFHPAPWTPKDSIDRLIEILNSQGPLFFGGDFGQSCYNKEAKFKTKKEGRCVYYWEAKSRKTKEQILLEGLLGHAGIMIGAEKTKAPGGGVVYWADPSNGSNPQFPEQQKFYVISYENFTTHSHPQKIIPCTPKSCFELFNSPFDGYVFYCQPEQAVFPLRLSH